MIHPLSLFILSKHSRPGLGLEVPVSLCPLVALGLLIRVMVVPVWWMEEGQVVCLRVALEEPKELLMVHLEVWAPQMEALGSLRWLVPSLAQEEVVGHSWPIMLEAVVEACFTR